MQLATQSPEISDLSSLSAFIVHRIQIQAATMRGIIPIPRDNMNDIIFNAGPSNIITNVSSNGYYGYQPQAHYTCVKNGTDTREENSGSCDVEMELEQPQEENTRRQKNIIERQCDRKRRWEHRDDAEIFKKRREEGNVYFYFHVVRHTIVWKILADSYARMNVIIA